MAEIIRMPRLSDTMEEGNIIAWLKKVGDPVSPGDILAEVETDKATMDLESFFEGTLLHIGIQEGLVAVDGIIAVIGNKDEDINAILASAGGGESDSSETEPNATEASVSTESSSQPAEASAESTSQGTVSSGDDRIKASPLAKSIAKENNINLANVSGSGDGGRIVKQDVEQAIKSGANTSSSSPASKSVAIPSGQDVSIPVSQMRKAIARRLGESKFTAPHFYLTVEINMERSIAARNEIKAQGQFKISFNDIIIKACALALRQHPMINASWTGDAIIQHGDVNMGVAVAVGEGLLVPVINNADYKPMHVISEEVREKAGRAREKRLKPDEMQGNTFTISNLGNFGIEEFTAIINPPDSCILAVGSIMEKPIVKDGKLAIGNIMKITLSCDHRVVDGASGAAFLKTVKSFLENPLLMLV
ncbi:MAG: pyruvate dehydrogenase E2 component (dihydrolipoamide acetyltransferase) [Saprospiraceae bacterium]|jgi:pyruvate dehydrogenase E2 component (dihydrolipoamide acetyltransferase)